MAEHDFYQTTLAIIERYGEGTKWLLIGRFLSTLTTIYHGKRKRKKGFGRSHINTSFEDTFRSNLGKRTDTLIIMVSEYHESP